jgi:2'-5' RNA ligase
MLGLQYAAVAYVRNPVGSFVEELRRELHPSHTHADAHITILPPRPLAGSEEQAIEVLQEVCSAAQPFEITMGDVESFIPATPTVFIRVAYGAYRMRELHDEFNVNGLEFCEPWPYMPHLTILKADTISEAEQALGIARQRWETFQDRRKIRIDSITFVRGNGERWQDVAPLPLGEGKLVGR